MKKKILLVCIFLMQNNFAISQSWVNTEGPEAGTILSLTSSNGKLYGTTGNFVYVSSDDGETWSKIGGDFTNLQVNSIAATSFGVHFKTISTIYTTSDEQTLNATLKGFDSFEVPTHLVVIEDTLYASGTSTLYKSVDGAANWEPVGSFGIGDQLHTDQTYLYSTSIIGDIKISRDGGASFETFGPDLSFELVTDIKRLGDRVVFSTNTGAWAQDQSGEWVKSFQQPGGFNSLAVVNDTIYGLFSSPTLSANIYASADTGKTWTVVEVESDIRPSFSDHNRLIEVNGKLYATAIQIKNPVVSSDGGLNWSAPAFNGLKNPRNRGLFKIGSTIYATSSSAFGSAGFGDGIFFTKDKGNTWEKTEINLPNDHVGLFNTVREYDGNLYATSIKGVYVSIDNGQSWEVMAGTESWYISDIAFTENRWIIAGNDGFSRIWTSTDNGANWNAEAQAIGAVFFEFHQNNELLSIGSNTSFIGTSNDAGATWYFANQDSGLGLVNGGHQYVTTLNETMYAVSTGNPTYYSSNDKGRTWEKMDPSGFPASLSGFGSFINVDGTLYLNLQETIFEGGLKNIYSIYKSNDGINFEKYITFDGTPKGFGFPYLLFDDMEIFAGYLNAPIYKYMITDTGVSNENETQLPKDFSLTQNYPNPFNPSTTINFTLATDGHVSLKVYNLLGQEVASLVDSPMNSGSHTVQFDASGLSSGVYIYRLQEGTNIQTKKMMLIK